MGDEIVHLLGGEFLLLHEVNHQPGVQIAGSGSRHRPGRGVKAMVVSIGFPPAARPCWPRAEMRRITRPAAARRPPRSAGP